MAASIMPQSFAGCVPLVGQAEKTDSSGMDWEMRATTAWVPSKRKPLRGLARAAHFSLQTCG
jgi:hypothetical protein